MLGGRWLVRWIPCDPGPASQVKALRPVMAEMYRNPARQGDVDAGLYRPVPAHPSSRARP